MKQQAKSLSNSLIGALLSVALLGTMAAHNYVLALIHPCAGEMLTGHQQLLLQIVMVL